MPDEATENARSPAAILRRLGCGGGGDLGGVAGYAVAALSPRERLRIQILALSVTRARSSSIPALAMTRNHDFRSSIFSKLVFGGRTLCGACTS